MITNLIIIFLLASNLYLAKRLKTLEEKTDIRYFSLGREQDYLLKKIRETKDELEQREKENISLALKVTHNEVAIQNLITHTNYKLIIPFENETAANKKKPSKSRSVNPKTRESKPTHRPKGRQTKGISKSTKASVSKKTATTKGSKKVSVTKKK